MTVPFSISYGLLWALVIFQSLVMLGLVRTVFELKSRPPGAADDGDGLDDLQGAPAPAFHGIDVFGEPVDSDDLGDELAALLFVSADCPTCAATLNQLEGLKMKTEGRIIVLCRSDEESCRRVARSYGLTVPVVCDKEEAVARLYGAPMVPAAVLVERGRVVRVGHPIMEDALEKMFDSQRDPEVVLQPADGNGAAR